eukprot:TRINITY_DN5765_c0_g1_i2.p1 TRINITY_DN5765_c0_g1~~TRINITY_DN5765_c0_g1_i2.p1  ORF type:complete len:161 (+),score=40.39 TRINITY_DN5765_c0_g1_i2:29-484(+)
MDLKETLKQILELQQQRTSINELFDELFTSYISQNISDFLYTNKLNEITTDFQNISLQIKQIQSQLNEGDQLERDMSDVIGRLQLSERDNLNVTVSMQKLETEHVGNQESYVEYEEAVYERKMSEMKRERVGVRMKINECLDELREIMYDL